MARAVGISVSDCIVLLRWSLSRRGEAVSVPELSLSLPLQLRHDRPQPPLRHWILPFRDCRPTQNPLLNIGRQAEQIHDLRHPRMGSSNAKLVR